MLKKFTNTKLLLLLGSLIAIYFIVNYTGGKNRSKSLRSVLVDIDTTKVTSMEIMKDGETLRMARINEADWEVELKDGKKVPAQASKVKNALLNLMGIKPSRLVSKDSDPAKRNDYKVDSTGTRVRVFEDDEKAVDIILGRFDINDQRTYHTYVRLEEDNEIYTVDDFISLSFTSNPNDFRNQMFLQTNKDSIQSIVFDYPDSAFSLNKTEDLWTVNGTPTDSTRTAEFINSLNYTTSIKFVDDFQAATDPALQITVKVNGEEDIVLSGYQRDSDIILNSSLNPNTFFQDSLLIDKLLIGFTSLMK